MGGFSVAYSLFSSVGKFAGPPRLEVLVRILPPLPGAPLWGRLSVVPAARLTAVSLAHGWRLAVFRAVAGCHPGIDGCRFSSPSGGDVGSFSYTLAFSRLTSVLSRCQILAWLVSWGRWLVLGWCLCLA